MHIGNLAVDPLSKRKGILDTVGAIYLYIGSDESDCIPLSRQNRKIISLDIQTRVVWKKYVELWSQVLYCIISV